MDAPGEWHPLGRDGGLAVAAAIAPCSKDSGTATDDGGGGDHPPSTVTDLTVAGVTPHGVTLRWTAPHGGSPSLLAYAYDLRLAPAAITAATWDAAIEIAGEPPPLPAGMQHTMAVTALSADTTLYFALKSRSMNGIWSAVSNSPAATLPPEMEVVIPDPNLEAVIRSIVQKPVGPLLSSDLATVTEIEADEKGIGNLQGLQYCSSLRLLNMRGNSVADLGPLTNLVEVTQLGASDNRIADLQPLSGMTRMVNLSLGGNRITDVDPLQGFANLNFLYLNGNPLASIAPLAHLVRLNHLFLAGTGIATIDDLSTLIHLANLDIGFNAISDLAPLVANPGLGAGDEIWVRGNPLSEASRNEHIPALRARGVLVHDQ